MAGLTERGQLEKRRRPVHEPGKVGYPGQPQQQDHGRIYPRVVMRPAPKHYGVLVTEKFNSTNEIHRKCRERG